MPKTRRRRRKKRRKTRSKRRYRRGGRITELPENRPHHDGALDQMWNRLRRLIEVVNRCHPNECRDAQPEFPVAVPVIPTARAIGAAPGFAQRAAAGPVGAARGGLFLPIDGHPRRRGRAGSPTLAAANHARLAAANHERLWPRRLDEARQEARAAEAAHDPRDGGGAANDGDDSNDSNDGVE
jgi:hypothetical protein